MATVYAVASAKGGVGKTTTTAAVATLLAGSGADVVAIDADIGMANLADALGIDPSGTTIHDVLAGDASPTDAVHAGPAGLRVIPGETDLDAYAAADPSRLSDVVEAFGDADYVLMDAGAGLSHDSTLPIGIADESLLVSTPERSALGDTEKTRQLAERIGGHVAGAAITRVDSGSDDAADDVVGELLDTTVLARIPEDTAVGEASAANEPLVTAAPTAPATRAYRELTRALTGTDIDEPLEVDETEATDEEDERDEDDIVVADAGPAGIAEEGDGTDIIVADEEPPESERIDEAAGDEREEAGRESSTDDAGDAKRAEPPASETDPRDEVDDDEPKPDDADIDDEPEPDDADIDDEPEPDDADIDDDPDPDGVKDGDAESLMGNIPDAEDPDRESTADHETEGTQDGGVADTEADEGSLDADEDDELAGSVPFRDDDEGTVGTALSRSADDEDDEPGPDADDEDDEKGGFFSRLLGR